MKILHTSDLHLGQIIYQQYDREAEHRHFFDQLVAWCQTESPDALLVSGDVFDIPQPSSMARRFYTEQFVRLHRACPTMPIVLIAGNHDSASRLEADSGLWDCIGVQVVGQAPATNLPTDDDCWKARYVCHLPGKGYVVAMPFYYGNKQPLLQALLDYVDRLNTDRLPVVLMAHQAVEGAEAVGTETGNLRSQAQEELGVGYDYLALGHIHRPHTIGVADGEHDEQSVYPSPVARYCGSALHVSADEQFPHTVSLVEMEKRGGDVHVNRLRIKELLHFYTLPENGEAITSSEQLRQVVQDFVDGPKKGYFRLRIAAAAVLTEDIDKTVEILLAGHEEEKRYNPRTLRIGAEVQLTNETEVPIFTVSDLQQMTNPLAFIRQTSDKYPELDFSTLDDDFRLIEERISEKTNE